jgi:hypothetical protein
MWAGRTKLFEGTSKLSKSTISWSWRGSDEERLPLNHDPKQVVKGAFASIMSKKSPKKEENLRQCLLKGTMKRTEGIFGTTLRGQGNNIHRLAAAVGPKRMLGGAEG